MVYRADGEYLIDVRGQRSIDWLVGDHRKGAGLHIESEHTTSPTLKQAATGILGQEDI